MAWVPSVVATGLIVNVPLVSVLVVSVTFAPPRPLMVYETSASLTGVLLGDVFKVKVRGLASSRCSSLSVVVSE